MVQVPQLDEVVVASRGQCPSVPGPSEAADFSVVVAVDLGHQGVSGPDVVVANLSRTVATRQNMLQR